MKLKCSATLIAALLTAISVFCANVAHTEYKSQVRKKKARRTETKLTTTDEPIGAPNVQLL
mgnify:CR=1 FL=1